MKNLLLITISFAFSYLSNAQTGTSGDPFTSLDQSANVTSAGIYYFDIGGTTFDTYVNENGFILLALDYGTGIGDLPLSASMDTVTRGIMNPSVLATLDGITEVRINSTTGTTDVITTNDSIISRIQNNMALHNGYMDTAINQDWVGLNDTAFTHIPTVMCGPTGNSLLSDKIMHNCGGYDSFTWFPESSYQREIFVDGEVPGYIKFQLWVKGTACTGSSTSTDVINSCTPITWMDGNTYSSSNNTATHTIQTTQGCDSIITLDLTIDPADPSASQNGFELSADVTGQSYQWIDCDNGNAPISGETNQTYTPNTNGNYAVIVDNGNCSDTSSCFLIEGLSLDDYLAQQIKVYPNPVIDVLNISSDLELLQLSVQDFSGRVVYNEEHPQNKTLDLSFLPKGIYLMKINSVEGTFSTSIVKL